MDKSPLKGGIQASRREHTSDCNTLITILTASKKNIKQSPVRGGDMSAWG